jgi:tripartite-type tricarboxylate transporter receptor subunit TctC
MTFILPFGPGGVSDPLARRFIAELGPLLKTNINIEHRPGGAGVVGVSATVTAPADGLTLGLGTSGSLAYQPLVLPKLPYRDVSDYQPIVKLVDVPGLIVVRADAPWKTFEEFLADARVRPNQIRVSISGIGSGDHLVIEQLNHLASIKLATVPFSGGGGETMLALLGGRVEANVTTASGAKPQVAAGKLRVLAVVQKSKERSALFPDAVPVASQGYNMTVPYMYCVIGPKGMPANVLERLVKASAVAARSAGFAEFADNFGYTVDPKGPEELAAEIKEYQKTYATLAKLIKK